MTQPVRMTPEDSAFWRIESDRARMHGVTLAIFEGPPPSYEELREHLARRVPLVPRFRQKVVEIPLDLGRPMWVDDPDFDIDDHLVEATTSVGMASLSELVSLIVSEQLDRKRPLWQIILVTGLPEGGWALVSKVHHSMIDGLFGTEPLAVIVDGAVADPPVTATWTPSRPPGAVELVGQAIAELVFDPAEQYRFWRAQSRRNRRRWEKVIGRHPTAGRDPTGLRGPVGGTRTWSTLTVDLDSLRAARHRTGASTHELVLALVAGGVRDLLTSRDEAAAHWPLVRAIVPMAVADTATAFHGGIEAEIVELPTRETDIDRRIEKLQQQGREATSNPVAVDAQIGVSGFAAPALASLGLREATRRGLTDRGAHTVIINVPGPRTDLSVLGRTMTGVHPVMPLAGGVRLSIGIISYRDHLTFGVTADRESLPDAHVVTTGIRRAIEELDTRRVESNHANR